MAWPPTLPPNDRSNATPLIDSHAQDHNQIVDALTALTAKGTVANPWRTDVVINPGSTGISAAYWYRVGQRVFVDAILVTGGTGIVVGTTTVAVRLPLPFPLSTQYPATGNTPYAPRGGSAQMSLTTPSAAAYVGIFNASPADIALGGASLAAITGTTWYVVNGSHLASGSFIMGQLSYTTDAP